MDTSKMSKRVPGKQGEESKMKRSVQLKVNGKHYDLQIGDKVDMIIDGGRCPGGKESTVVDLTGEKPVIVRQGAIPQEEIELITGALA